ncbi:MAG: carboxypeptidase-like regulatory domain-containing protein [Bacteroidales bacterium]|nr:carboxypeptidase-like regulatory domain-containing protein [Bacteroidales bacterium]
MKSIFLLSVVSLVIISCNNKKKFVKIIDNKFYICDTIFYPIMINYCVTIRELENKYFISPIRDYEDPSIFEGNTYTEAINILKLHLKIMQDLGFNSIRIIPHFDISRFDDTVRFCVYRGQGKVRYNLSKYKKLIFEAFDNFLEILNDYNFKIMIVFEPPLNVQIEDFLKEFLKRYSDNSKIFAYDLFNEPLYFDRKNGAYYYRDKKEVKEITNYWRKIIKENAPNHLFTIGFSEPIEVFAWDPTIIPVDFIQFHTYHPLRVPNEIYWYTHYTNKPCMIGETSLPADNDSISWSDQVKFLFDVYKVAISYGCIGFGWWQFQEVRWGGFEHDYTAIISRDGDTVINNYKFKGKFKPVAFKFKDLKNIKPEKNLSKFCNYYNMLGYNNFVIYGRIVDKLTNKPIEGALIRGWTKWWDIGANTYSNENGEFTLYSNAKFVNFRISAPGKTCIAFEKELTYENLDKNFLTDHNLPLMNLEYHSISFQPFLDSSKHDWFLFNFDCNKFNKAKFKADLGTIYLEDVN